MMMANGKVRLTQAEIEHNKEYERERNKLIPAALQYADNLYGDRVAPLMETDIDRQFRDSKWNYTFHTRMNYVAKEIIYKEEAQAC